MARVAFVIVLFVLRSGRRAQFPACLEREEGAGTGGGATGGRFTETRSCDHDSESVSVFSLLLFFSSSGRPATHQNIASVPLADDNYVVMIIVALSCTYCMYVRIPDTAAVRPLFPPLHSKLNLKRVDWLLFCL